MEYHFKVVFLKGVLYESTNDMMKQKNSISIQSEIDHQVKNNLNMVSSILGLHILDLKRGSNQKPEDVLIKSKLRIEILSMIHDVKYKSKGLLTIDFKKYIEDLCILINKTCNSNIEVKIDTGDISLSIETMQRFGIIINELLINSLSSNSDKKVEITLKKNQNNCLFTYHEKNGDVIDIQQIKKSKTLGMKLIALTIKQMKAHMNVTQNGGFIFRIEFRCE